MGTHGVPGPTHVPAHSGGSLGQTDRPSAPPAALSSRGMLMNEHTCDASILPLAPSFFLWLLQRSPSSVVSLYSANPPGL